MKGSDLMPCFHPLKGWNVGVTKNGKVRLLVTSYEVDHLEIMPDNHIERCLSDKHVYKFSGSSMQDSYYTIPCGKCIGCRLEQSRQWANRCLFEMQYHDSNYFVTLTYDDEHLPTNIGVHPDTGEFIHTHSLVKSDFQKFMKRLRENYPRYLSKYGIIKSEDDLKLRYFAAGEYGDKTARPHYHAIIFGLELYDTVFYKRNGKYNLYSSPFLSSIWSTECSEGDRQPLGYVVVAPATWETAAYTARYCTSKLTGPYSVVYDMLNICPPFTLMSRKPGIGYQYLEDHLEGVMENDLIFMSTEQGSRSCHPPKYFKRKFDEFFEEDDFVYLDSKEKCKLEAISQMEETAKILSSQTDNSYLEMLAQQEVVLKAKVKALERSL